MRTFFISLLLLASGWLSAQDNSFGPTDLALQRFIQDPGLQQGEVAVMAINLDNGRVLVDHNAQKSMIPASIQKLVTTSVALEKMGADYQFKTDVYLSGSATEGVHAGNIIIKASGDPTLQSRYYKTEPNTLDKLAASFAGMSKLDGKIIIDASLFDRHTTSRGWIWEDMGNYFGATPTAFMWQDNLLEVYLKTGQVGTTATLAESLSEDLSLDIQVEASSEKGDNAWFFGSPGNPMIYAKGTIPAHQQRFLVKAAHPKPEMSFAKALGKKIGTPELQVEQQYLPVNTEGTLKHTTLLSPPLATIVKLCNERSINLYAEALLLQLDAAETGKSMEGGITSLQSHLKNKKVSQRGVRMVDGSGLSPLNRTTAQSMVDLLTMAHRSTTSEAFKSSLAVAGRSGTIAGYFKGTTAEGKMIAKSGTMHGVRNYAGYITNKYDETIAFCVMMNDYNEARKAELMKKIEALVSAMVED